MSLSNFGGSVLWDDCEPWLLGRISGHFQENDFVVLAISHGNFAEPLKTMRNGSRSAMLNGNIFCQTKFLVDVCLCDNQSIKLHVDMPLHLCKRTGNKYACYTVHIMHTVHVTYLCCFPFVDRCIQGICTEFGMPSNCQDQP